MSDDTEDLLEENQCTCPDIWDCPNCLYNCEYCLDIRELKALSEIN
jgi:hypothetical protein